MASETVSQNTRGEDSYIEQQIVRTGKQVKIVELISAFMLIGTGTLAYLLLVAVVDHWILNLGTAGRWIALLILLGCVGYCFWHMVLPLLTHRINPTYSALTIEKSYPSLKNSLINFLLLRRQTAAVPKSVFEIIEQKAAQDLTVNSADAAVDRSQLIKMGYVLAGVFALGALYFVVSPKSPLASMQRVVMPWASIDRPARFKIRQIEPGDLTTFQGAEVDVSAIVEGPRDHEVVLVFSTDDGQIVDRQVPMTLSESGLRHECRLPADGESNGLQQSLTYRIKVGDAVSPSYRITVEPAPTILVERMELQYPAYTKRPKRTITGTGDITTLEGTQVTLHGKANFSIRSAHIDFNARADNTTTLSMETDDLSARRSFVLELQSDRQTPQFTDYLLRFVTKSGQPSRENIVHPIEVTRDLAPEIEFLTPREDHIEVRENGRQLIEIRALDPDFATQRVILRATAGNTDVLNKSLLDTPREGQVVARYYFQPRQLGLKAGDRISYRAIAEDNRTTFDGTPRPNVSRTRNFTISIVKDPNSSTDPAGGEANDPGAPGEDLQGLPPENAASKQANQPPEQNPTQRNQSRPADQQKQGDQKQDDQKQDDQKQGDQKQGDQKQGDQPQPRDQKKGDQKNEDQKKGGQSQTGAEDDQQQKGQNAGQKTGDGSSSNQRETGDQASGAGGAGQGDPSEQKGQQTQGGEPGNQTGRGSDRKAGDQTGTPDPSSPSNPSGAKRSGQPSGDSGQSPQADDHDGQVFERLLEKMRRERQQQQESADPSNARPADDQTGNRSEPSAGDQQDQQKKGSGDRSKQGPRQPSDSKGEQAADSQKKGGSPDGSDQTKTPSGTDSQKSDKGGQKKGEGGQKKGEGGQKKGEGGQKKGGDEQKKGGDGQKKDGDGQKKGEGGQKKDGDGQKKGEGGQKKGGDGQKKGEGGQKKDGQGQSKKSPSAEDKKKTGDSAGAGRQENKSDPAATKKGDEDPAKGQGQNKKDGGDASKQQDGQEKKDGSGESQKGQGDRKSGDRSKQGNQGSSQDQSKKDDGGGQQDQGKKPTGSKKNESEGGEEQTPGNDKKKSDSQSGSNGDRSGDGQKGAGQQGNRQGNDTAGSSSPGDEGANASRKPGQGEDSQQAGRQKKSDRKTGQKGREKGDGSKQRSSSKGQQSGNQSSSSPEGSKQNPDSPNGRKSNNSSRESNDGGGIPSDAPLDELGLPQEIPDTENARLEYAKMATAKVLEYLKHHQDDQQKLKEINLTPEDVQRMIKHYDQLNKSQAARQQSELNDELRSLGLRPPRVRGVRRTQVDRGARGGLGDDGGQRRPPKGIIDSELFDAFIRGAARGEKE